MEKLREIATILGKEETDFFELTKAIEEFENIVTRAAGLELEAIENRENIYAHTGMALGTTWAAMCIKDLMRTKVFVKGIMEAVEKLKKEKNDTVTILYAGTGPFATLILPLLATYGPKELQCVLLEINTNSFNMMQSVIHKLGFQNHVKAFVNEDASTYDVEPGYDVDILLSETMQRALAAEQQVPIMMHLMPQLKPEAKMIPEAILLEAGLMDISLFQAHNAKLNSDTSYKLGVFYELTKNNILLWNAENQHQLKELLFPRCTFIIPAEEACRLKELVIFTHITVFGNTKLKVNESGLTLPLILKDLRGLNKPHELSVHYKVDKEPGVLYELLPL